MWEIACGIIIAVMALSVVCIVVDLIEDMYYREGR